MNFKSNKLPNSSIELKWYWGKCVKENLDFSNIIIDEEKFDFTKNVDYFDLTDNLADKISFIGRQIDFFEQPIALTEFEFRIFDDLNADTQIGVLLSSLNHQRTEAFAYGIYATFIYIERCVYCAFTICLVDKDFGIEMETAVVEIGQDEEAYIQPIFINEEALYYFNYDDIAKLSYWLGNFWVGIQYEMNNRPEEIRIIEHRESTIGSYEAYKKNNHIVLVKRIIPIDKETSVFKHDSTSSGREYTSTIWGVRGHYRTLPSGKVVYVNPYRKGKNRDKLDDYDEKEYQFVREKIDSDLG